MIRGCGYIKLRANGRNIVGSCGVRVHVALRGKLRLTEGVERLIHV